MISVHTIETLGFLFTFLCAARAGHALRELYTLSAHYALSFIDGLRPLMGCAHVIHDVFSNPVPGGRRAGSSNSFFNS